MIIKRAEGGWGDGGSEIRGHVPDKVDFFSAIYCAIFLQKMECLLEI